MSEEIREGKPNQGRPGGVEDFDSLNDLLSKLRHVKAAPEAPAARNVGGERREALACSGINGMICAVFLAAVYLFPAYWFFWLGGAVAAALGAGLILLAKFVFEEPA